MAKSESSFYQLFKKFAWSYKLQLLIGVVAGGFVGGAQFWLLKALDMVSGPLFEGAKNTLEASSGEDSLSKLRSLASYLNIPLEQADGTLSWQCVAIGCLVLLFFFFSKALATFVNTYMLRWVGASAVRDMRNYIFGNLQHQSLAYFGQSDIGKLISRCTNDTTIVEGTISNTVANLIRSPMEITGALVFIVMAAVENELGAISLSLCLIFPVCVMPVVFIGKKVKRYSKQALQKISELVSRMQENFTGIKVVKAYDMEETEIARFNKANQHYFKRIIRALRAELFMAPMMQLIAIGCACVFLIICYANDVKLSQLIPMGMAAIMAYKPIKEVAKINVALSRTSAAADRIIELVELDTRLPVPENPVRKTEFNDRIIFDHVDFSYSENSPQVIKDMNLEIKKGQVIAFVGETGSGKSTVANLLARFYDPTSGTITIDGEELKNINISDMRHMIGIVTQDTILFNESIAFNISYGTNNATAEAIEEAAKQANAHEFIMDNKAAYDHVVGEKGCLLSGGQKQRISIARAILKNPPILILDEATSALDTATEQLVQEAINHVMENRTVFAIAHRLSTIRHADQICVLEKGVIVEHGTHQELYDAGGKYKKLCDIQFA